MIQDLLVLVTGVREEDKVEEEEEEEEDSSCKFLSLTALVLRLGANKVTGLSIILCYY
jgi:hypothetical protein